MTSVGFQLSSDQAEAYDSVSQLLQAVGIDLNNAQLLPVASGKSASYDFNWQNLIAFAAL